LVAYTDPFLHLANAPLAMTDDTLLPFSFPAVRARKITAAFDGGRLTSDGGVMLLAMAERRLGVADRLARCFPDRRDPTRILHTRSDMIRARIHAIACGYEDADDLDFLRADPAFKLACGRLPESGVDLCSQPTLSRLENAPSLKDAIRLTYALVDQWMASYEREPEAIILDIDDTCDVAHGHQQLSLFNAHYDERCFLPIHVYDTEKSRPVAVVLRPGKTPGGVEVRAHLRRLVRHIRKRWTKTRITFRGDGHYARPEAMEWCEKNGVAYVLGLSGTKPLSKKVDDKADEVRVERALENKDVVRGYAETRHKAKSWTRERRAVARIEATALGLDIRFVVTNLEHGSAEWLYDTLYCARGQAENLIKLHKTQLSSDRTSCRSAIANQVRLVLHTAAYWLMLTVRDAIPKTRDLAKAEFATLRLRLIKIAARVIETARSVRLAFAACHPEAELFASLPGALAPLGP
jgi:DDE family transposase